MNKLKGKVALELTLEEVNTVNALIERDIAKAVVEDGYNRPDGSWKTIYRCPICREIIIEETFCPKCGQRVDRDNIAL